ncbi:MAG: SLC13 family permease [Candidatus Natronoplasma sp.]
MGNKRGQNPVMGIVGQHKKELTFISLGIILFLFVYLSPVGALKDLNGDMRAALGILLFAATLWITESVPLYVTSIIIVLFQILFIQESTVSADEALAPFFSPIIALFLGGFVLAAALSKYKLDIKIAKEILRKAGKAPKNVMLALMGITAFLSMWMSNTATTALMVALAVPIYTQIPKEEKFKKAIILGIPFAANIGGMGTPIGTPPNAIIMNELASPPEGIEAIRLTFLDWMLIAMPVTLLMLLIAFLLLYFSFKPSTDKLEVDFEERTSKGFSGKQTFVMIIFFVTVFLWLTSSIKTIGDIFQHPGIIALIPPIAYFSTGILDEDDLSELNWDVLLLMGGGLSLGNAIQATGLADEIVGAIPYGAWGLILIIVVFAALAIILSTFMSNTATAALMAPIMIVIGADLGAPVSIMASVALACSMAMALPVSTPPNAIAYGTDVIEVKDMIKYGSLISLIGILILMLIFGYGFYYY